MTSLADRQRLHALVSTHRNCQQYSLADQGQCTNSAAYSMRETIQDPDRVPQTVITRYCYAHWNELLCRLVLYGIRDGAKAMMVDGTRTTTYHMDTIKTLEVETHVS